jgi:alcohol dehydrogenase (cytochrome c)
MDAETGKVAWRFHTIARPGDPGGDSWNGVPLDKRTGASVWTPGSYDPALGLAFFGTGQTYDIRPLQHPSNQPGITSDALYTDSTLALDVDTGKLAWHFQHQPNDQWDLDWAFEQQLVQLPVDGQVRTVVVTAGKTAIYEAMDAATGRYLFSMDLGLQNITTAIDPKTGAKTANPAFIPGDGTSKVVCPHAGGAKSWIPGAYDAATKTLFVTLVESCMDVTPAAGRGPRSMGVEMTAVPRPGSDGKYGRLEAINLQTREVEWTMRQRAPETSGVLATAGGLVFAGSMDRYIRAYDETGGKMLWQGPRLNDVSNSCPITYTVNGKQYVAVVVGLGGYHASTYAPLVPEIQNPPDHGAALWVFKLPEKSPKKRAS